MGEKSKYMRACSLVAKHVISFENAKMEPKARWIMIEKKYCEGCVNRIYNALGGDCQLMPLGIVRR